MLEKKIEFILPVLLFLAATPFGHAAKPQSETEKPKNRATPNEARPNILFIVSDDHGWGDLPANGADTEVRLPTLDALANKGVRFPNYHTVPLCGPARACMFTGQYSTENGMWRGPGSQPLGSPGYRGIKRDVTMLSEHLAGAGYNTGAFGKWHMGALEGEVPNDRGFDEFHGFIGGAHPYWIKAGKSKIQHNGVPDDSEGHATELFTQWAETFIRESAATEDPFFCYLAYNAVHGPLRIDESQPASAPEAWVNKALDRGVSFLRSDYVAILEHMDHHIGRLVDLLDELDVAENTLVVFVSDNGGCTMEEVAAGRFPGNNGPFQGGKATTYQGGLNVPFLMNWKGRLPQGTVSDAQTMHCDIFATLLDAAGIPVPEMNGKNPVRGMSLMPHMLSAGKESIPERTMIFELWGNIGLRKGDYKLWADVGREHSPDWDSEIAALEHTDLALFDLSKDVAEKSDLRTGLPEVYASLKAELIDHFANINAEYLVPETSEPSPKEKPSATPKPKSPAPSSDARTPEKFFKNGKNGQKRSHKKRKRGQSAKNENGVSQHSLTFCSVGSICTMPRAPRIEFENACYHIMARGNRREPIVFGDDDRKLFVKTLSEAATRYHWEIFAWVLMDNHYHFVLRTPKANLVEGMQWLQNAYTRRLNAKHQLWGHLFGGRYRSILIENEDSGGAVWRDYLRTVIDYVHLNPGRAGLVDGVDRVSTDYPWSSLAQGYQQPPTKRPKWLAVSEGLDLYGEKDTARGRRSFIARYDKWCADESGLEYEVNGGSFEARVKRGWFWGSEAFKEKLISILENGPTRESRDFRSSETSRDWEEKRKRGQAAFLDFSFSGLNLHHATCSANRV